MQIYAVWDKGRENAPDLVRRCLDRWEQLNHGHQLVVLDRAAMLAAMPPLGVDPETIAIQAATDILRVHLMATRGGVWTDATVLPVRPLDDFVGDYLDGSGMFFFASPGLGRRIASWFIAAHPGQPALARIDAEIQSYWDRPRKRERRFLNRYKLGPEIRRLPRTFGWKARWLMDPIYPVRPAGRQAPLYPYFWFHQIVGYLEKSDPQVAAALATMTHRPADPPHALQKAYRKMQRPAFEAALPGLLAAAPIHKLDWRRPVPESVFATTRRTEGACT
jgi:hypothetical protein